VQAYVRGVEAVCRAHGIDALLTLTVLNDRCIDSTVPVLFDPDSHEETVRAHACHAALFDEGRAEGFIPYRVGPRSMDWIVRPESSFFRLVSKLKGAVDPAGILDPGRYALAPANDDPAGAVLAESGTYAALSRASGAALR
jgi:4-cresol dehydrogenase (hydroxylating)